MYRKSVTLPKGLMYRGGELPASLFEPFRTLFAVYECGNQIGIRLKSLMTG